MSELERFIKKHAEKFNDEEPGEGHLDRFEQRLNQLAADTGNRTSYRLWMKIAASIVILVTAGLIVFELATNNFSGHQGLQQATLGLPDEIVEVIHIFNNRANAQIQELDQMAQHCPGSVDLIARTRNEVDRLDKNMDELVEALKENPSSSQVQTALIRNCKAKEAYLNDALLQGKMQKCRDNNNN